MQPMYIIKNNEIYEVTSEDKAVKINIVNGIAKKSKETIDYEPAKDFLYAFFEIRAKFSYLFEQPEEVEEKKEEIEQPKVKENKKTLEKEKNSIEE